MPVTLTSLRHIVGCLVASTLATIREGDAMEQSVDGSRSGKGQHAVEMRFVQGRRHGGSVNVLVPHLDDERAGSGQWRFELIKWTKARPGVFGT